MQAQLQSLKAQVENRKGELQSRVSMIAREILDLEGEVVKLEATSTILNELIHRLSVGDLAELERLITWGLRSVFELDYGFKILVETKRNVKTFKFIFLENGFEAEMTSIGGGVRTVIGLLLRLYVVAQLKAPKILFLDEYFHNLDEIRTPNFIQMVKTLCRDFQFDILAVTHYKAVLQALDTHYHLTDQKTLEVIKSAED